MINGGMMDTSKMETSGQGIPDDNTSQLGEVAEARSVIPEDENQPGDEIIKTDGEIEQERLATEEAEAAKTPEEKEAEREAKEAEANAGKTEEEIATEKQAKADLEAKEAADANRKAIRAEFLKEMGVSSEDELKAKLKGPEPAETEEQKKSREEKYTANLISYATENNIFNANEFATLSALKQTPDVELAYAQFSESYKEINKDRKGEDNAPNPVTDDELREAFNQQYHINSEDAGLKAIGEKSIKDIADSKRNNLEQKYESAKTLFDDKVYRDGKSKEFFNFINTSITAAIPDKLEFTGKDDVKVNYNLKAVDKKEIEKLFINDKAFEDYLENGASQPAKDYIAKTVEAYLWYKNKDEILKTVSDASFDAGTKKARVGATAPFGSNKQTPAPTTSETELNEADKLKLKSAMSSPFARG